MRVQICLFLSFLFTWPNVEKRKRERQQEQHFKDMRSASPYKHTMALQPTFACRVQTICMLHSLLGWVASFGLVVWPTSTVLQSYVVLEIIVLAVESLLLYCAEYASDQMIWARAIGIHRPAATMGFVCSNLEVTLMTLMAMLISFAAECEQPDWPSGVMVPFTRCKSRNGVCIYRWITSRELHHTTAGKADAGTDHQLNDDRAIVRYEPLA